MTASDTKTYSARDIAKMVATGDHAPPPSGRKLPALSCGSCVLGQRPRRDAGGGPQGADFDEAGARCPGLVQKQRERAPLPHERCAAGLRRGAEATACLIDPRQPRNFEAQPARRAKSRLAPAVDEPRSAVSHAGPANCRAERPSRNGSCRRRQLWSPDPAAK